MNQNLRQYLYDKYPDIFASIHLWGIECGDGWFSIINNLCRELTNIAKETRQPVVVAAQVKEKFGGLRFYTEGATTEKEDNFISKTEDESYEVCEECGSTEKVSQTRTGWVTTLCEECQTNAC